LPALFEVRREVIEIDLRPRRAPRLLVV
jgi:hypothetical protein